MWSVGGMSAVAVLCSMQSVYVESSTKVVVVVRLNNEMSGI